MKKKRYGGILAFLLFVASGYWEVVQLRKTTPESLPLPEHRSPNDPGWERDLKLFKYRETEDAPLNLQLYYRETLSKQTEIDYRGERHLSGVVELGPQNISGRSRAYLIDRRDPDHHFAGSVSGGLWETTDNGANWTPQSDREENMSVTFIAQNPFQPDVLYYSTGEVAANSADVDGVGVFKSTDGGKHFELLSGSQQNGLFRTWRIVCSRTDANTLYVASNRGIYVSTNAGGTFEQVYFNDCTDMEVLEDSTVYIAAKGRGIFKSKEWDLKNWEKMEFPDFGERDFRRIEMAVCDSFPNYMYAALEDKKSTKLLNILRSEDGGTTWEIVTSPSMKTNYAWYTHVLQVHPERWNVLIYGNIQMMASYNGGKSWKSLKGSHVDKHLFYFDPHDPDHFISTHDGGMDEYLLFGDEFLYGETLRNGFNVTQYYAGAIFPEENRVIGGTQDNGTSTGTDDHQTFERVFGADGGYCAVSQEDPNIVFWSTQNGKIYRTKAFFDANRQVEYITGENSGIVGSGNYFIAPLYMNAQHSNQLLFMRLTGAWYTDDFGDTWTPLDTVTSRAYAGLIVTRAGKTTIFTGGTNGRLLRYDDVQGGISAPRFRMTEFQPRSIRSSFLRNIVLNPRDSNSLYVCLSSVSSQPRVWRVDDAFGDAPVWVNVSGDLPEYLPVNDIAVSALDPMKLAAGTDYGVYTTIDGGVHWQRDTVIPNVAVFQLKIRPTDDKLFVFTHGRGAWMADFGELPVATQSPEVGQSLALSPNPSTGQLQVEVEHFTPVRYEIVGMTGEVLLRGVLGSGGWVSVQSLVPGRYHICLYDREGKPLTRPFVKL